MFEESQLQFPEWKIWLVPGMLISDYVVMILQIWHFGFSHFLLPIYVTVYGNFDFMRVYLKFGGCLYAQMGLVQIDA